MNKLNKIRAVVAATLLTAGSMAHAALPASVGTSLTAVQTDATSIFDLVFPVVASIFGLVVVIKLFKRFGNKI